MSAIITAELSCLLCGRSAGQLVGSVWPPPVGPRPPCPSCGSRSVQVNEVTRRTVRVEPVFEWERSPRGRPPGSVNKKKAA